MLTERQRLHVLLLCGSHLTRLENMLDEIEQMASDLKKLAARFSYMPTDTPSTGEAAARAEPRQDSQGSGGNGMVPVKVLQAVNIQGDVE